MPVADLPTTTTTTDPFSLPTLSPSDLQLLNSSTTILHLLCHRNKNQHRRSIWWRSFSLFRRHLQHLTTDLQTIYTPLPTSSTNLARVRHKAALPALRVRTEQRCAFWRDVLVARWQRDFSQVVADGRFAVLGLVLLAVLAETCKVVGVIAEVEMLGQREVERVLEEFGREEWGTKEGMQAESGMAMGAEVEQRIGSKEEHVGDEVLSEMVGRAMEEDVGEVVIREQENEDVAKVVKRKMDAEDPIASIFSKVKSAAPSSKKSMQRGAVGTKKHRLAFKDDKPSAKKRAS